MAGCNTRQRKGRPGVLTTLSAAKSSSMRQRPASLQRCSRAFTLAELAVTIGVLMLVVLLFTQILKSAATVTIQGHKRMDADSQARQVLDRIAIDFAQMVKRSDVDYYLKSSATGTGQRYVPQPRNDVIAFYSSVPGYHASTYSEGSESQVSLVAYRINAQNKLERMGKA